MNLKTRKWKKLFFISAFLILFLFVFSAQNTRAGLVNCELESGTEDAGQGTPCDFCKAIEMIGEIINFLLYFVIAPLAVVAFVVAGGFFLFGGTQPNLITKGRKTLQVTVIGTVIAFSAWIAVNTVIDQLGPNDNILWLPWNEIPECNTEGGTQILHIIEPSPGTVTTGATGTLNSATGLKALNDKGIDIIDTSGRTNTPCEMLPVAERTKCTGTEGLSVQAVDNLTNVKTICSPNNRLQVVGLQEKEGHSDNTNHGDGYTADLANQGLLNCIRNNKQELNVKRIGCNQGAPACDFRDPGSLHIEFNQI